VSSGSLVLDRAVDVCHRLNRAGIECAIGGALALAYHVDDPRATQDIDVNVALPASSAREAVDALPPDVPWDEGTLGVIARDDQVRIWWPVAGQVAMPLDLFFAADPFHAAAQARSIEVPMGDATVRVLAATDLAVFKALFDRPKDWVDIAAMAQAHDATVDLNEAADRVAAIVGGGDARVRKLRHGFT
jgi:hypothetical protein